MGNLKHITFHCDIKLLGGGVIFFKFPHISAIEEESGEFPDTGEMYTCQNQKDWRSSQYDWKQLGLLAAAIIFERSHEDIVKDPRVRGDVCLNQLIHEGKCYLCRAV